MRSMHPRPKVLVESHEWASPTDIVAAGIAHSAIVWKNACLQAIERAYEPHDHAKLIRCGRVGVLRTAGIDNSIAGIEGFTWGHHIGTGKA